MNFYVLVATAVYDQGVVGVYATEQLARDAAEEIWPKTDGHHHFRIDVCELDKTYEDVFDYTWARNIGVDEYENKEKLAAQRGDRDPVELNPKGAPGA